MSRTATDWAWSQSIKPATHKLILLSMADRADEYHCCYPSIARLEKDTGLDRKTIQKGVAAMIENGLITDTGKRTGATNQVRVLRLNIGVEVSQKRDGLPADKQPKNRNVTENGNNPKNGMRNDPKNGMRNDPKNGIQNQSIEPPNEPLPPSGVSAHVRDDAPNDESVPPCPAEKPKRRTKGGKREAFVAFLVERGVAERIASDWWEYQDSKAMTDSAWKRHCQQAAKAGITPEEAADYAAGRRWQGFYADSYLRDEKKNFGGRNGTYQQSNRKLNPVEQFYEAEREWAEHGGTVDACPVGYDGWQDGQFREV